MSRAFRRAASRLLGTLAIVGLLAGDHSGSAIAQPPGQDKASQQKLIQEVWERLLAVFDAECPEGYDVWPPVLDPIDPSAEINAFASRRVNEDGKVEPFVDVKYGFMAGIVEGDADRLAFVLGHELGHHVHRHVLDADPTAGTIIGRAFGRSHEEEADTFGLQLALKAGYSMSGATDTWKRFNDLGLESSSFEGKGNTHPTWLERVRRIDTEDRAALWESMIAFRNGVFLLEIEQFALAERCFREVVKEFPDCYEGWANLGFAQLMLYCDALDADDLRKYNLGHLALGAFYRRPTSLEQQVRGVDEELWFRAVGSLRQALILNRELVVPKINLGVAYMLSPSGPQVGRAEQFFDAALRDAGDEDSVDSATRAAILINAAVADLAAGRLEQSSDRLTTAAAFAAAPTGGRVARAPHFLNMATQFNRALVLASAKGDEGKREAVTLLQRSYLMQADPSSAWWTLAYEHYERLSRELDIEPKPREELARKRGATWRPITSVALNSGKSIDLVQTSDQVLEVLGTATRIPVIDSIRLERFSYPDLGVDLLATHELLAIRLFTAEGGSINLRGSGLGTIGHELRVGMDKAEFERLVEREFPAQGLNVKRVLRLDGLDALYHWYPSIGLAVLTRDDKVLELIVVPITRA